MIREGEREGSGGASGGCPRLRGPNPAGWEVAGCPALDGVCAPSGSRGHLGQSVEALLDCRAFLWDVLTDGGWTGCARRHLKRLSDIHGADAVGDAFDRG